MAENNNNNVYIDVEVRAKSVQVELAELTAAIAKLKDEQARLNKQQKSLAKQQNENERAQQTLNASYNAGEIGSEEYRAALAALQAEQASLSEQALANAADLAKVGTSLQLNQKALNDAKAEARALAVEMNGSVESMRAQLATLTKQFDALPEAERKAAAGQDLQKKIQDLTAAISEQEQATGRFQRNVGNYQSIWEASAEKMEGFGGVLAKVFGENSIITRSVNTVAGFGRSLKDLGNQAPQATSSMSATAQAAADMGDKIEGATRRTVGFQQASQRAAETSQQAGQAAQTQGAGAQALAGGVKGAVAGIKAMTQASLRFIATPIGAIIAAIAAAVAITVAAFKKLQEAFQRSDDASTALDSLKGRFKVLGDFVGKVFNAIVAAITPVIETISKLAGAVLSVIPGFNELAEAEEQQVRLLDELQDRQRAYKLMTAANAKEQARLQTIYNDSTKSAKEREEALLASVELDKQAAREQLKIAQMQLKIEQAKLKASGDTSDAAKNRLAELQAAVLQAEAAMTQAEANATRKLSSFRSQQASEAKQAAEAAKKRAEDALKRQQERAKTLEDLQRKGRDARLALIKEETLRAELIAKAAHDKEMAELEKALADQRALVAKHQRDTTSEQYRNAVAQVDAITNMISLKGEALAATIADLARKRDAELLQMERSNAELRVAIMAEGREKIAATYELQSRDLEQAMAKDKETYANAMSELSRLLNEGLIDEADYLRRRDDLQSRQAAQAEYRALQAAQIAQQRAKAMAEINIKETSDALAKVVKAHDDALKGLTKGDIEGEVAILQAKQADLQRLYDAIASMDEATAVATFGTLDAWRERVEAVRDAYNAAGDAIKADNDTIAKSAQDAMMKATAAVSSLVGAMANYYAQQVDSIIGDNETLSDEQKRQALDAVEMQYSATMAGIVLSQASGIASTYAAAAKAMAETVGGPAAKIAAMIAVVTSGIATLLTGITQARTASAQYEEQKSKILNMARGGLVQGAGTATSDSIPARLSNGESVMTAAATAAHYDQLSRWNVEGGGRAFPDAAPTYRFARGGVAVDYSALAQVMRDAVSDITPVVSVKEITRVANRVKIKEQQII